MGRLIEGGRITGELAAIAVVAFVATSWIYLYVVFNSDDVVILTKTERELELKTLRHWQTEAAMCRN